MDLPLLRPASDFILRRRHALALLAAAGITSYAAYNVYHHPVVVQKRQRLARLLRALLALTEALTESVDTVSLIAADLGRFLRSDSDEIPASIRQISKIAYSDEHRPVILASSPTSISSAAPPGHRRFIVERIPTGPATSRKSRICDGKPFDELEPIKSGSDLEPHDLKAALGKRRRDGKNGLP